MVKAKAPAAYDSQATLHDILQALYNRMDPSAATLNVNSAREIL